MAALAAERGYALSCGRLGRGTRVSVFHVKLTESALSAFEAYQGRKESVALRPSIQFQGSQGHISIPRPDCPTEARTFSFYLSNIGKDSPQGSFDCIQQYVSSDGNIQLDCLGTIQDKITVCATDDSYQKAKQNMALAESDLRSRGAIVIKPGGRYVGKKVQMRKPAPGASDTVPSRIRPTPVNLASAIKKSNSAVSQRPFRDRVMHLLALKPYKKPELILRLQKDRLSPPDKDSLDMLLQQVANVNAKDSTCTLKDHLYREVQKDWPGYTESDRLLLKKILSRKPCPPQNTSCPPETPALSPPKDQANVSSSPPQKRPQPPEFTDPLAHKRPRISRFAQRTQATFNGKLGSANGREASPSPAVEVVSSSTLLPPLELPRPHDPLTDVSNDLSHNGKDSEEPAGRLGAPGAPRPADSASAGRHHGGTHSKSKKKLKKHRERERKQQEEEQQQAREKPHCEPKKGGPKTGPLQDATAGLNGACNSSSVPTSTSEMPDYLLKYAAISSSEQRQSYKNDFNAEYSEYRDLHARIERITRRFTQLDSQLKQLSQGSEEYKTIHDQILQEYRKIKKTNPNYSQEKNRCEYLHNKLAHIKKLIAEYDHQQF